MLSTHMQDVFMESYFASQRDQIFRNVEVLIYIIDVESRDMDKDLAYFQSSIQALSTNSKDANIFCLIHKMDLIAASSKQETFARMEAELLKRVGSSKITCFGTSIWDETLFKAWSSIVYSLIPNVKFLETQLQKFCELCDADEVILFERSTFLVISHVGTGSYGSEPKSTKQPLPDPQRFEKVSNIIKQFKLSCSKNQAQFQNMEIRCKSFSAYVDVLTPNAYVLVLISDPSISLVAFFQIFFPFVLELKGFNA
ncbi:Interleukin-4 receptor subunit alpha [Entophlyctis sp. JEL0112]|nr:Interleukin-4 receptor subunit alpha [Entophlyctis sp. JEL0112]